MAALAIDQGGDDVTEGREREVYLGRFLQALARRTRLALALGALVEYNENHRIKKLENRPKIDLY